MTPTELRIGNLVECDNDIYPDRENKIAENIYKVNLVCETMIKLDIGFGASQRYEKDPIYSPKLEDLKPIPITPEWLERAGFKKDEVKKGEMAGWTFWRHPEFIDVSYIENDAHILIPGWYLIIGSMYLNINNPIHYVHHFQNCQQDLIGKELEFKES